MPSYQRSRQVLSHIIILFPSTLRTDRAHANMSNTYRLGRVTALTSKHSWVTAGTAEQAPAAQSSFASHLSRLQTQLDHI